MERLKIKVWNKVTKEWMKEGFIKVGDVGTSDSGDFHLINPGIFHGNYLVSALPVDRDILEIYIGVPEKDGR